MLAPRTSPVATPQVDWRALAPIVILLVGGIVLLTFASLTRKRATTRWYAPYTVGVAVIAGLSVVPLWARVQGWDKLLWSTSAPIGAEARSARWPAWWASTGSGCS